VAFSLLGLLLGLLVLGEEALDVSLDGLSVEESGGAGHTGFGQGDAADFASLLELPEFGAADAVDGDGLLVAEPEGVYLWRDMFVAHFKQERAIRS
jgi:hypothetical protein